jgi:hypothetical protein
MSEKIYVNKVTRARKKYMDFFCKKYNVTCQLLIGFAKKIVQADRFVTKRAPTIQVQ